MSAATSSSAFEAVAQYLAAGGMVMPPLMLCAAVLWYCLGWRWMTLKRGTAKNVRTLINSHLRGKPLASKGLVDGAIELGLKLKSQHRPFLRERLDEAYADIQSEIRRYRTTVTTIVAIAPLLGLLGTVIGMIETFDSLGDMSLFAQSGGIAGGIATALFTTQLGLVVAVPGLIAKSFLDRRQRQIEHDLKQIKDILCSQAYEHAEFQS